MEVRSVSAPEAAEFLQPQPGSPGLFLQTGAWAQFEEALGNTVEHLGFWEGDRLIGTALVVLRTLPGGFRYAYAARGPVTGEQHLAPVLEALVLYFKAKKILFLRVEPPTAAPHPPLASSFVRAPDVQPRATVVLDLRQSADELLKQMHDKTRYNIRLSERKGLTWRWSGPEGLEEFWQLLQVTSERDGFTAHPKAHYQKLLELYGAEPLRPEADVTVRLAEVFSGSELLAANLLVFSRGVVTYLHGASSTTYRELMPTYLLHWRTLQEAKSLGFTWYDLWGVAPSDGLKSSWQGISRFKLGFGGQRLEYAGAFDYRYQVALYKLYQVGRVLRHSSRTLKL